MIGIHKFEGNKIDHMPGKCKPIGPAFAKNDTLEPRRAYYGQIKFISISGWIRQLHLDI